MALLLDFAFGQQPFSVHLLPGTTVEAALAFYPSAYPLRALLKGSPQTVSPASPPPLHAIASISEALAHYSHALAQNPWLPRYPLCIAQLTPWYHNEQMGVRDRDHRELPLAEEFRAVWE